MAGAAGAAAAAASAATVAVLRLVRTAAARRGRVAARLSICGEGVLSSSGSPSSDISETTEVIELRPLARQPSEPSVQLLLGVSGGPLSGVGLTFSSEGKARQGDPRVPVSPGGSLEFTGGPGDSPRIFASAPSFSAEGKGS